MYYIAAVSHARIIMRKNIFKLNNIYKRPSTSADGRYREYDLVIAMITLLSTHIHTHDAR